MSTNAIPGTRPRSSNVEQPAVELERLVDVADLEGDVVDPDQAGWSTPWVYLYHEACAGL